MTRSCAMRMRAIATAGTRVLALLMARRRVLRHRRRSTEHRRRRRRLCRRIKTGSSTATACGKPPPPLEPSFLNRFLWIVFVQVPPDDAVLQQPTWVEDFVWTGHWDVDADHVDCGASDYVVDGCDGSVSRVLERCTAERPTCGCFGCATRRHECRRNDVGVSALPCDVVVRCRLFRISTGT